MAKQEKEVLWELKPHTEGKHLVLRAYLDAYFPIMLQYDRRILFIDGFSGPGEYKGGEDGSPIIAIKALQDHKYDKMKGHCNFHFIDKDPKCIEHLKGLLAKYDGKLRNGSKYSVTAGAFDETVRANIDALKENKREMAPAFIMVDPFGVSDTPMDVLRLCFENSQCEVFVSVMYAWIHRFIKDESFERHLDGLFGCEEWRKGRDMEGDERTAFIYTLYREQLRKAGAKHIVYFELYRGNALVYAIFHGTKNVLGCGKMKEAIWRIIQDGSFKFRRKYNEVFMFEEKPDTTLLRKQLVDKFKGKSFVPIEEVEEFVMSDETPYHKGHLRKLTLTPMEKDGAIEVLGRTGKRGFPEGCKIRFL